MPDLNKKCRLQTIEVGYQIVKLLSVPSKFAVKLILCSCEPKLHEVCFNTRSGTKG